jgi:hypothetical protein
MTKFILTTTVLLVGLTVSVSAQNRSAAENLRGLRNIGLAVEYAQADGLEAAKQPAILQRLQDRARTRLKAAEVPLLETTGDDIAGRPRLVFVVTANKQVETAPAILVEGKLYERVRLSRDPAKETDLATWVMTGIGGPRVTEQMLFAVFDGQVDQFIKYYSEANPKTMAMDDSTASPPTQLPESPNSLQGLSGCSLFLAFRRDARPDADQHTELQKALQKEAEAKLTQAGIPVLRYADEMEKAGKPLLYLFVKLSQPGYQAPAIEVQSSLWQQVRPIRDLRKETQAVTWQSQSNDGPTVTDEAVRRAVHSQLDEFIKAYTAANPKPPTTANAQ